MLKMKRNVHSRNENVSSLTDQRLRDFINQLNDYFKDDTQSTDILKAILNEFYPSASIQEIILHLYSNALNKPTLNKLLDKSIVCLHLNDNVHPSSLANNTNNCQLIHHAIRKDYENILRLLLKSGFDPNGLLADSKTPLSIAAVADNLNLTNRLNSIQLLIEHGANPVLRDVRNVSPFERLCGMGKHLKGIT